MSQHLKKNQNKNQGISTIEPKQKKERKKRKNETKKTHKNTNIKSTRKRKKTTTNKKQQKNLSVVIGDLEVTEVGEANTTILEEWGSLLH